MLLAGPHKATETRWTHFEARPNWPVDSLLGPLLPYGAVDRFISNYLGKACKKAGMY
jgi:hypothetical protein